MSVPTQGNFDCARLQEIKTDLDSVYNPKNELYQADLIPDVAPLKMVQENQTVKFAALEDPLKDNTVKATWLSDCDEEEPAECTETCTIDGDEIGAMCKDFELDLCFQKSFSVTERKFRLLGNEVSQNQEVAINLARKIKLMDEQYARLVVAALDSAAGTNLNTSPYTVSATSTAIPAAAWNPDLFGYFQVTKSRNKMPAMKLLLGGLMEQALWKIGMETSNPEGASAARKVGSLGTVYSDSFVTEDVLNAKAAFLVSPAAIGITTKAYHTPYGVGREEVANGNKQIMYTVKSQVSGIVYDVTYQVSCFTTNGVKDWKHTWEIKTKGGIHISPTFCNTNRTGVLKFLCA